MAINMEEKIVFCKGGGCTAKLGAGVLSRVLEKLPRGEQDPSLLVGYDSRGHQDTAPCVVPVQTAVSGRIWRTRIRPTVFSWREKATVSMSLRHLLMP